MLKWFELSRNKQMICLLSLFKILEQLKFLIQVKINFPYDCHIVSFNYVQKIKEWWNSFQDSVFLIFNLHRMPSKLCYNKTLHETVTKLQSIKYQSSSEDLAIFLLVCTIDRAFVRFHLKLEPESFVPK